MNRLPPHLLHIGAGLVLLVSLLALSGSGAVPEPRAGALPADAADLVPASTSAYVEVNQPAALVREITALLKGSVLEDMPAYVSQFREKQGNGERSWFPEEILFFSQFLGPEGLAEASRFKAGFVALTGFAKNGEPELTGALLTGTSNVPGFVLRTILTVDQDMRIAETVDGVRLYREYSAPPMVFRAAQPFAPPQPAPPPQIREFHGPTYALLPGALVIGSNPFSVRDLVLRARGKPVEQTLASVAAFKQSAPLRSRPGLFAHVDLRSFAGQLETAYLANNDTRYERALVRNVKLVANPQALGTFAAGLALQRGAIDCQARLTFDPKQDIPWLGLLPEQPVSAELLHYAPADSIFALAVSLADGQKRWEKILALADRLVPGGSLIVRGLEDRIKLHIGTDLLARINGVSIVWAKTSVKGGEPPPLVIALQSPDAEAAKALVESLVQLARFADPRLRLSEVEAGGQRLHCLRGNGPPLAPQTNYGRSGAYLVLGEDAKLVAATLTAGAKKQGLLSRPQVAAEVQRRAGAIAVGVWSLARNLADTLADEAQAPRQRALVIGNDGKALKNPQVEAQVQDLEKLGRALARAAGPMSPAILSLTRKPDRLELELRQAGLPTITPAAVNLLMELQLQRTMRQPMAMAKMAVPPPPPPVMKGAAPVAKDKAPAKRMEKMAPAKDKATPRPAAKDKK